MKTKTRRRLILTNDTGVPVTNVSFRYEDAEGNADIPFDLRPLNHNPIAILSPSGSQGFPILQAMGSPDSAMCVVTWTGPDGLERETRATVSIY